jgi:hypothetical protein
MHHAKSHKLSRLLVVTLLATVFLSSAARADSISLTLTEIVQTGAAGTTVTFDGSLTNLTGGTIFLNGAGATVSSPFLTVNDNPFLINAPLSLAADASSGPFALFTVSIAPGTPLGTYGPSTFLILGGANNSAFGTIGSTQFTVDVSSVPEPGTIVLLSSGLLGLGTKRWFRKQP